MSSVEVIAKQGNFEFEVDASITPPPATSHAFFNRGTRCTFVIWRKLSGTSASSDGAHVIVISWIFALSRSASWRFLFAKLSSDCVCSSNLLVSEAWSSDWRRMAFSLARNATLWVCSMVYSIAPRQMLPSASCNTTASSMCGDAARQIVTSTAPVVMM